MCDRVPCLSNRAYRLLDASCERFRVGAILQLAISCLSEEVPAHIHTPNMNFLRIRHKHRLLTETVGGFQQVTRLGSVKEIIQKKKTTNEHDRLSTP